jgi:phosphoserine phosphatase
MQSIQLVSSDMNGTLVHQHTMSDMIRFAFPHEPGRFEKAKDIFARQTSGQIGMSETFQIAGDLTKGLTLRAAVEYTLSEMRFLDGYDEFVRTLRQNNIRFVINSTGYSITTEVIRAAYGPGYADDVICNRLVFGLQEKMITENELTELVIRYCRGDKQDRIYDDVSAVGTVELGIRDESEKARLLFEISDRLNIPRTALVHIGDTIGDSGGITETARHGGVGIAFNYNEALKAYLENILKTETLTGKIFFVSPKSAASDIRSVLSLILPEFSH